MSQRVSDRVSASETDSRERREGRDEPVRMSLAVNVGGSGRPRVLLSQAGVGESADGKKMSMSTLQPSETITSNAFAMIIGCVRRMDDMERA